MLFFFRRFHRTLQKVAIENDICRRSGKILRINILTEWDIIGFLYSKVLEIEGIIKLLLYEQMFLILLKYESQRTSTPNLKHVGVVL